SHALCRELLDTRGRSSLEKIKAANEMRDVELVLPDIVFSGGPFTLHIGNKTFQFWSTPGHSIDSIVCHVKEDRVLFAADTLMPIPYFVDGNYDDFVRSLQSLQNNNFENIVQGHGEVILRGEVEEKIQNDLHYLATVKKYAEAARSKSDPDRYLDHIDIERCG